MHTATVAFNNKAHHVTTETHLRGRKGRSSLQRKKADKLPYVMFIYLNSEKKQK